MAIEVFAVRMDSDPAAARARLDGWAAAVSDERRARADRFRRWEDRWRSYAGELLASHVMTTRYGMLRGSIEIVRDSGGKPHLRCGRMGFNVSHSGAVVAAAFGDGQVGIDVEQIGEADMDLAAAVFTAAERGQFAREDASVMRRRFYELWTAKESYVKALGTGLAKPLQSFSVILSESDEAAITDEEERESRWQLRRYSFDPAYCMTVCAEPQRFADEVRWIAPGELLV